MTNKVETIGVMFARVDNGEFPTVDMLANEPYGIRSAFGYGDIPDIFADWLCIASDPSRVTYYDEDTQAMDETNYAALTSCIGDDDEDMTDTIGYVLVVHPESPLVEVFRGYSRSLADYPLLDEMAYSEREYEAWMDYAPQAFRDEVIEALRDDEIDEATAEYLDDHADAIMPMLAEHLHYYYGFSGEYGPNFLDIYRDGMRRALAAV
jgi:hypothetical protein